MKNMLKKITKLWLLPLAVYRPSALAKTITLVDNGSVSCGWVDSDDVPTGQGPALAAYLVHAANMMPGLVRACRELADAEAEWARVEKEYPAGVVNCEDAHQDADNRIADAQKAFKAALKAAEEGL